MNRTSPIPLVFRLTALVGAVALTPSPTFAQQAPPPPCGDVAGFERLDFWVGEWVVFVGEQKVGTNRIEKILGGCAILEHWRDVQGGEGKSLFYYLPAVDEWKQVWVTPQATVPGGVKEKTLVEMLEDGALRFQGTIARPDGTTYFDRTTLTPLADGTVRQVIEVSRDGQEWQSGWDAIYRPAE